MRNATNRNCRPQATSMISERIRPWRNSSRNG